MVWRNVIQLEHAYTDSGFRDSFSDLYVLRQFLRNCIVPEGYRPPKTLGTCVRLTAAGDQHTERILESIAGISPEEARLAAFLVFSHRDLLVDIEATDPRVIRASLHDEIRAGNIRYPWVYGRLLYERFFEMFPSRTANLTHDETVRLLAGTPQGVFQLKDLVVGPFGVLQSACHRLVPPVRTAPLWHCSDPACSALHVVMLGTGQSKASDAATFLAKACTEEEGPPSEWHKLLRHFVRTADYYDDMHPGLLPWLLVNGFGQAEIRAIVQEVVEHYPVELRETLVHDGLLPRSHSDLESLSEAECFQLALLVRDETLAECIERCIEDRCVLLPATETRSTRITPGLPGWFDSTWQCSRHGVRAVSQNSNLGVLRLKRLIRSVHETTEGLAELEWRLRHTEGETTLEKLDTYVRRVDPRTVVREVVFSSPNRLQAAFNVLRYGRFSVPSSPEDEDQLVDKILWKLGFDTPLYPQHQRLFWERRDRLLETARTATDYNETQRESIRGAGANFFVSLEEILDYSLLFSAWALLSDHYAETRFTVNFDSARRFMASRLSRRKSPSGSRIVFDPAGKNTLRPLVAGFGCLAELCAELLSGDRESWTRSVSALPGYCSRTELHAFPFLHKALLFDLRETDRERILTLLREVSKELDSCRVVDVRNRIEHKRAGFPSQHEIERACTTVSDIVTKLEDSGLSPLLYFPAGHTADEYRRRVIRLRNYRGRELEIRQPSELERCGLPPGDRPSIVVPTMRLPDSPIPLRFTYQESSDYARMWDGYPRRRARDTFPDGEQTTTASEESSVLDAEQRLI